jgi:uncharacterized membrane protein (UPF0127 family)
MTPTALMKLRVDAITKPIQEIDRWHTTNSDSRHGERKALEIKIGKKEYRVTVDEKVKYQGPSVKKAAEVYINI